MKIDTLLSPAELPALAARDLSDTTCVVFDVFRATSSFVTALHNGARGIIPVSEIADAVAIRQRQPEVLLAGERGGVRILAGQSGGLDFDFGNSPREFTRDRVRDKTIVSTTTNGTRALRACSGAKIVLASAFLNLAATARFLNQSAPDEVLLVCAGTQDRVALEDVLAAGALSGLINGEHTDSTEIASRTFHGAKADLPAVLATSENARRLLGLPDLRADVAFCAQRDLFKRIAAVGADGEISLV
ncbi:MAG TPA: 2-phosphosulfolactate phosphatase [Verrucomicrobiae bacterium]